MDRARARCDSLNEAMAAFDINTPERQAMFLANIGHETGGLVYLSEIWGPSAQQKRYERDFAKPWPKDAQDAKRPECAANRLAWGLGNVKKGDGSLFRGHGDLQNTGRTNHCRARDRLRARFPHLDVPDFEAAPMLLATPKWAALAAGDYIAMKDCNAQADAGNFDAYCDLINRGRITEEEGDTWGYDHRLALFERALPVLQLIHY
jgi:putative chitinase